MKSLTIGRAAQSAGDMSLSQDYNRLLRVFAVSTFIIFFQIFMVAPLIPLFTRVFHVESQVAALIVPAYLIPYGFATLLYGVLSDYIGRRYLILGSLIAFALFSAASATSQSIQQLIGWRLAAGFTTAAVVPQALTVIGDIYPYQRRGKPLGLIFAALAGGMAAGKSCGLLLVAFIGWRGLFIFTALSALLPLFLFFPSRHLVKGFSPGPALKAKRVIKGYKQLVQTGRGRCTYFYVLLNSIFHGGVYTWLGVYFSQRYHLGEVGIAMAIIGYGVPGLVFSRVIGKTADRRGRRWLIPAGLFVGSFGAVGLVPQAGVFYAAVAVLVISFGFDLTQPLFAGIVTDLGGKQRTGQAMGLNVFLLFNGFGIGTLIFGRLVQISFNTAVITFAAAEFLLCLAGIHLFRREIPGEIRAKNHRSP